MSTPAYNELVAAIRSEGEAILTAGRQDLDAPVKTCGDWTMRELLAHVGRVYRRAATAVEERATTEVKWQAPPDDLSDVAEYLADALDDLVAALSGSDPDTPVWNWSEDNQTAQFWARRMAHESSVHRYDAQRALDLAQPVDADLAHDGLDELIDLIVPRVIVRDSPQLPTGIFVFGATDDASQWCIRLEGDKIERLDITKEPDVTVQGTASALLLAAYGRVKWSSLEIVGDESLLDEWTAALRF